MAANFNIKTALTGGLVNCVDRNTAGMKVDTSICLATISGTPNLTYVYMFSAASMLTADGVSVIIPYGQSAGTAGRWILNGICFTGVTAAEYGRLSGVTGGIQAQIDGKQSALGFTPVRQGGGAGQLTNTVYIGWDGSRIKAQVDAADQGFIPTYTGNAPSYQCRAWGNFNGADGSIRDSRNVSSVTRLSTGKYAVVFSTAMPVSTYAILPSCSSPYGVDVVGSATINTGNGTVEVVPTTSGFTMSTGKPTNSAQDLKYVNFSIFA